MTRTVKWPVILDRARSCPPHLQPTIPAWWPLDPADGPPLTGPEREARRRAYAATEGCKGPRDRDGKARHVIFDPQEGPPPVHRPDPGFVYVLDESSRKTGTLVYRYSPTDSPGHAGAVRAVEDAFLQMSARYALRARETTGERPS